MNAESEQTNTEKTPEASFVTVVVPEEVTPEHTPLSQEESVESEESTTPEESSGNALDATPNHSTLPTNPQLVIALLLLLAIFGVSYVPWADTTAETPTAIEKSLREEEAKQSAAVTIPEPDIEATSAFVWDIRHQRTLYAKNASAQLPLASLTKIMTSLVALQALGNNGKVAMTLEAIGQDGPSDFADGETFNAKALSDFSLVSSSNDGAYALAAAAGAALTKDSNSTSSFVSAMNARAEELGLSQTYFVNPTGLDENNLESGSYGSARDMAFLMEYLTAHHPEVLESTRNKYTAVRGTTLHTATNTNDSVGDIPGLLGSKTGFTDLAGGNLVIAFDAGLDRPIIISVLGSSRDGRFKDVAALVAHAQQKIIAEQQ